MRRTGDQGWSPRACAKQGLRSVMRRMRRTGDQGWSAALLAVRTRSRSRTGDTWRSIADRDDVEYGDSAGQRDAHIIVDAFAEQAPSQRRVHADVVFRHIEFVRPDEAIPS